MQSTVLGRFIKRWRQRRAKRKEIAAAYKRLTSHRIRKASCMELKMEVVSYWIDKEEEQLNHIANLQQELCRL